MALSWTKGAFSTAFGLAPVCLGLAIALMTAPAGAQSTPTAPASGAEQTGQDPPARVGRLAKVTGTVSFRMLNEERWDTAVANVPITSQQAIWTEPNAGAEVEIGTSRIVMGENTELDLETVDDRTVNAVVAKGEVLLRTRQLRAGETFQIRTPRGEVAIENGGYYAISAGETARPTTITVRDGTARITAPGVDLRVATRQSAVLTGTQEEGNLRGEVAAEQPDALLQWQLVNELPPRREDRYQPPPVVERMTGFNDIEGNGEWAPNEQYGRVWYPPVERDWVPYRQGRWAFVPPWGWTWVDDAPWGFAPFHYGRWAQVDERWAWVPTAGEPEGDAADADPVYSPALVAFLDAANAMLDAMPDAVGWVPLAPWEPYVPWYGTSFAYIQRVNITSINIRDGGIYGRLGRDGRRFSDFHNHVRGATFAPGRAMAQGGHIGGFHQPPPGHPLQNVSTVALPRVQPNTVGFHFPNGQCSGNGCGPVGRVAPGPAAGGLASRSLANVRPTQPFRPPQSLASMPGVPPANAGRGPGGSNLPAFANRPGGLGQPGGSPLVGHNTGPNMAGLGHSATPLTGQGGQHGAPPSGGTHGSGVPSTYTPPHGSPGTAAGSAAYHPPPTHTAPPRVNSTPTPRVSTPTPRVNSTPTPRVSTPTPHISAPTPHVSMPTPHVSPPVHVPTCFRPGHC